MRVWQRRIQQLNRGRAVIVGNPRQRIYAVLSEESWKKIVVFKNPNRLLWARNRPQLLDRRTFSHGLG